MLTQFKRLFGIKTPGEFCMVVGVILLFIFVSIQPYLETHGRKLFLTLFKFGIVAYYIVFLLILLLLNIKKPTAQRMSAKEDKIVQDIICDCLRRNPLDKKELADCVRKKLDEDGIFYISAAQIRDCIEKMVSK
jgi:hypothetical protein